ncbi:hypothetical protein ACH5RR_008498 [Cinchona calisaya]|uniref:gibberellin 3beta-dioxygenase n=1 Tax=Cinchona calisaya TaxID=153742 RepID=A0ABD3ABN0_9GENT
MPSRISDCLRANPVYIHHKQLDLNLVKGLPDSHAWTNLQDDYPSVYLCTVETVPVVDLDDKKVLDLVGHACKTWGVFQVRNHGISKILLDEIESTGKRLFSLPMHQKLKASRSPDGISGYGLARISSFFPKIMWSEGFTIIGSPVEHAHQLWPQDCTKFCDVIQEYEKEMKKLARKLILLILGSLGLTEEDVKWAGPEGAFEGGSAALQFNSYPVCPEPDRAMGLAAHTDSTILTILHQNNTSGLQVLRDGNGWVTVPPLPGALVVNIGDLLHILSNGLYPSVLHRVIVNRTQYRLSIAYLYGPQSTVKVSPLHKLIDQGHPPLYGTVTWSEYLGTKAKYFDKALSSIRIYAPLNGFGDTDDHKGVTAG